MRASLRIAGITICAASLAWLGVPDIAAAAPAASARAGAATTLSAATIRSPEAQGTATIGLGGWQVQSSAATTQWTTNQGATQDGAQISVPGFAASGWLPVRPDNAGAVGTEVEALVQNGVCPDDTALEPVNASSDSTSSVFYSDNLTHCFGAPMTSTGADTDPLFDVPWWFRTTFANNLRPGQDARLVINGVMGQADVWVNGTEVATEATVEGDYTSYSFDVSNLLRSGTNALALELYPNNPNTMFTLDDVDWNQIPPDNNTGIQFPVQLRVASALGIANTYVTQHDAPDLSSAALTVHADVTNNSPAWQSGTVTAAISPPDGGAAIQVSQQVTLAAGATQTIAFRPTDFRALVVNHPQLWWPYQMGGQPLYQLQASVSAGRPGLRRCPGGQFRHPLGVHLPHQAVGAGARGRAGVRGQRRAVRLPGRRLVGKPVPALLGGRRREPDCHPQEHGH